MSEFENPSLPSVADFRVGTETGELFVRRWTPIATEARDGRRSPIVLFHDSLGCVALWKDFPERLSVATGREVIAYDRLGYGRSDAHPGESRLSFIKDQPTQYFAGIKQSLEIDHFVVLGHSVGGAMAALCAGQYPDACQALITLSALAFVEDRTKAGILEAQQAFKSPELLQRLERYHGTKAVWALTAWFNTWLSPGFAAWQIESEVSVLKCPVLAVQGRQDEYASVAHPIRYLALTSNEQRLMLLDDCQHFPHREQADRVITAITDFLQYTN
jgi:pimeloyl-ACP methyl ester carboxylesterase